MRFTIFALLFGIVTGRELKAHPLDLGYVQLKLEDRELQVSLDLNPRIVDALNPKDRSAQGLARRSLLSGTFLVDEKPCVWGTPTVEMLPQTVRLKSTAHCPLQARQVEWRLPFVNTVGLPPTFQVLVKVQAQGSEHLYNLERGRDTLRFTVTPAPSFAVFVRMGMEHIGAMPNQWRNAEGFCFPDGIDHILFLLGLLLGGGGLLSLLKTATGFTLGHSLTLALASFGWVQLPSRWVESAIALSIAYVAAEDIVVKKVRHRFWVATFFGLVHGFGFASALAELHLSRSVLAQALVGFNLGVELGQGVLVLCFGALLAALSRNRRVARVAVPACAAGVFVAGSFWFIQRAFGLA